MRVAVLSGQLDSIQGAAHSSLIIEIDTSSSADCNIADDFQPPPPGSDGIDRIQGTLKLSSIVDLVADVGIRSAPIPEWCLVYKNRRNIPPVATTMPIRVSLVNVIIAAAAQLPKGESERRTPLYCFV